MKVRSPRYVQAHTRRPEQDLSIVTIISHLTLPVKHYTEEHDSIFRAIIPEIPGSGSD